MLIVTVEWDKQAQKMRSSRTDQSVKTLVLLFLFFQFDSEKITKQSEYGLRTVY